MNIADLDFGGIASACGGGGLVALVDDDGEVDVLHGEVLESYISDVAVAAAGGGGRAGAAAESFDAGAVFGVDHGDVFDEDVGDDVFRAGILTEGTNGYLGEGQFSRCLEKRVCVLRS